MIRVFIGYDPAETVALHVAAHSIWRHASRPVSITPLMLRQLPLTRERDPRQSTEFAFSRFLVPWLCNYEGHAIFMDCDMLCRADITELWELRKVWPSVQVVQHDYTPSSEPKFLNQPQTAYARKNWSSVMLFNNALCQTLTPEYVNAARGLDLHQFVLSSYDIGELPSEWNHLVGEQPPRPDAKLVHFTRGTPCFAKYRNCEFADEWHEERRLMESYSRMGEFSLPPREGE